MCFRCTCQLSLILNFRPVIFCSLGHILPTTEKHFQILFYIQYRKRRTKTERHVCTVKHFYTLLIVESHVFVEVVTVVVVMVVTFVFLKGGGVVWWWWWWWWWWRYIGRQIGKQTNK